jgi:hypothetical protein
MQILEIQTIERRDGISNQLEAAKRKNNDPSLIEQLENDLIRIEAQVKYVGEELEKLVKEKDNDLLGKLPIQKKRTTGMEATNEGTYEKENVSLIIHKNY